MLTYKADKSHNEIMTMFTAQPWAILPEVMDGLLAKIAAGIEITAKAGFKTSSQNDTAIIPLTGFIDQHASWILDWFGGTSCDEFGSAIEQAANDSRYKSIVINVDSPGGSVYGVQELSDKIFSLRGKKQIIAVSNSLNASAAYWISSAAHKVYVNPSSETGSVGVIAVHQDISEAESEMGVKTTIIKAGRYKAEGNMHQPLDDEATASIQGRVDDYYDAFTKAVARNRGVSQGDVKKNFGEGRVLGAKQAVACGMADKVVGFNEFMAGKRAYDAAVMKKATRNLK